VTVSSSLASWSWARGEPSGIHG